MPTATNSPLLPPCPAEGSTSTRKPHNHEAGYIAQTKNPYSGGHTIIYLADAQGIDTDGDRYAIVCCIHGTLCGASSLPTARQFMKSAEFCEACSGQTDAYGHPLGSFDYDANSALPVRS